MITIIMISTYIFAFFPGVRALARAEWVTNSNEWVTNSYLDIWTRHELTCAPLQAGERYRAEWVTNSYLTHKWVTNSHERVTNWHLSFYRRESALSCWLSRCWVSVSFFCFFVLQYTAALCNTLQRTATHCNTLHHAVTHCNTLQHTATLCNTL